MTTRTWTAEYAETIAFMRDFWLGETAPERPAIIMHQFQPDDALAPADPDPRRNRALKAIDRALRLRVRNGDDYVPWLDTSTGPNAMASAFGEGRQSVGSHWETPVIADIREVDRLVKPPVHAGAVGEALAVTRAMRELSDLPIRSLDLQSPLTIATQLLGVSDLFMAMYDEPRRVHALLELLTDFTIEVGEAQRAAAGDQYAPVFWPWIWSPDEVGIQLCDDYLLTLSPEQFEEFSLPCLQRIAEHFNGIFLHSCSMYAQHLPSVAKIPHLRGVNCDLSMSAPLRDILDALPGVVVAPHIYMNKEISRPSQIAWLADELAAWKPGDRLCPIVLAVIYDDAIQAEQPTDWAAARRMWDELGRHD